MQLETMYAPQKDSPSTFLAGEIGPNDIHMVVASAAILPQELPFPLTLAFDRSITETVIVTALNVDNNQLTVTRGAQALSWVAGTKCARIFTANDLEAVQKNVKKVAATVDAHEESISENAANIAKNTNDISQEVTRSENKDTALETAIGNEATRAANAETSLSTAINNEITRAINAENNLQNSKINRSELTVLITDATFVSGTTTAKVTFTAYNAAAQEVGEFERFLPIVSNDAMGVMTPEAYAELQRLRTDVNALQQQGGKFIGISFPTKADLDAYDIPGNVNVGDFTYVLDDETYSDATTRYIYNGTAFQFGFVVNFDPVGLANSKEPGLVKSDSGTTGGKIFVETDGTMSVIGWQSVLESIAAKVSANNAKISFQINGIDVDDITLNQATNKTINFSISGSGGDNSGGVSFTELDDLEIRAGQDIHDISGWKKVIFDRPFTETPIVTMQGQNSDFIFIKIRNVTINYFEYDVAALKLESVWVGQASTASGNHVQRSLVTGTESIVINYPIAYVAIADMGGEVRYVK